LEKESKKTEEVIEFVDEDLSYVINELSLNNLLQIKRSKLERIYEEKQCQLDHKHIDKTLEKFKTLADKDKQHRIWKLSYGIVFMCLYVLVLIDENNYLEDRSITHPIK
jgi:hypothetical protein